MTREEAVARIKDHIEIHRYHERNAVKIFEALDMAIQALEQTRWIPVSERLPEKPNMYTVTDSKGDVVRFVFTGSESSREYWLRCAKAWLPLPKPYKENTE